MQEWEFLVSDVLWTGWWVINYFWTRLILFTISSGVKAIRPRCIPTAGTLAAAGGAGVSWDARHRVNQLQPGIRASGSPGPPFQSHQSPMGRALANRLTEDG